MPKLFQIWVLNKHNISFSTLLNIIEMVPNISIVHTTTTYPIDFVKRNEKTNHFL